MSTITLHPILARLRDHFPVEAISWRVGPMTRDGAKTKPLAYIDARDVQDRLDEVLGLGWDCKFIPMPNGTCCCEIAIIVDGQRITRSNGADNLTDSSKPEAREMALKGAYSDAFKRAAVMFGVGQYLYGCDAPWVRVDERKQIDPNEMPKLHAVLRSLASPANVAEPAPHYAQLDRTAPIDDAIPGAAGVKSTSAENDSALICKQLMSNLRDIEATPAKRSLQTEFLARKDVLFERMNAADQHEVEQEHARVRKQISRLPLPSSRRGSSQGHSRRPTRAA